MLVSRRAISLAGYAVLLAALMVWEGFGIARGGEGWPTMSDVIRSVRSPVVRWLVFGSWLWAGWHVFVRTWGTIPVD
ncbi:MAG TPA: DUF6186 family protein [Actinomycetota bacterium]|nr:DUF6186 family protein [Actinomycetota bacterium]